jgi:nitrogenase iron protein NifH
MQKLNMSQEARTIAIYGKGGIGKSTTSSNLSAAASMLGIPTMLIGCDPKADSIQTLLKDKPKKLNTILDLVREKGTSAETLRECIYKGLNDIICVESGGPIPGMGCAGKGVAVALDLLKQFNFLNDSLKLIFFDVLGDVVCGGFAQPMRARFAKEVYIVTSGEYMSIYQAVNIAASIAQMVKDGVDIRLSGLICNKRNVRGEDEIVDCLATLIGIPVVCTIPRTTYIQKAESQNTTVIEAFPDSDIAKIYYQLVIKMYNNTELFIPTVADRFEILEIIREKIGVHNQELEPEFVTV